MPPTLRLRATGAASGGGGSQVETSELQRFSRPNRAPAVLRLKPVTQEAQLEAFRYSSGTTAIVTETDDFVEVSDGPPGSGLCQGERRSHDGVWTERFIQQTGVRGGAGAGKGAKGNGKGKGSSAQSRDFGQRMGRNSQLGQRWKESWQKSDDKEAGSQNLQVERHVQEVDDLDAADDAEVLQEWEETEVWMEPLQGQSASSSSSSSSAAAATPPSAPANGQVLMSRTWTQTGRDRRSGRTWKRTLTRRQVQREDEVVEESDEELEETEVNGDTRGSTRKRVGRSLETSEWGNERGGANKWRSSYSLQTLVNSSGEVCTRECIRKWYNNGEEEQNEEWETLDEYERAGNSRSASSANLLASDMKLRRRIKSGRKDGRQFVGEETEWHERWENQEVPINGELKVRRKKLEKWWRENAKNNAWGEHSVAEIDRNGGMESLEQRKWYDNGTERQDEKWTERPDGSADGTKEGARGSERWGEKWIRTSTGEAGQQTVEKWHDDGLGKKVEHKEGKRWVENKDVEWHHQEIGEVVGQGETWTVNGGGNISGDVWYEAWKEKQDEKSCLKTGRNAQGDTWRENWVEEYDTSGIRVRQQAEKEGSNARGDAWYETWIEEQEQKKRALKRGSNAAGEEWTEEWGEEARPDGSGYKWTSKWADDGLGNRWGDNWGDEWGSGGDGGKRWVEKWNNKGQNEKHNHDTSGRPEH